MTGVGPSSTSCSSTPPSRRPASRRAASRGWPVASPNTGCDARSWTPTSRGSCIFWARRPGRKAGNLTIQTTNRFSIISIINWDIYQGRETQNDQQNDQLPTSKRPHTITKEHKHNKRGATLAPEGFLISDKMREYAKDKGYAGNLEALTEKFMNFHQSKGNRFVSWEAAWRNWLLNELKFHPAGPSATDQPLNQGRSLEDILS